MKTDTDTSTYIPKHASQPMLEIDNQLILANLLLDCKSIKLGTNPYTKMKDTKEILDKCLSKYIALFYDAKDKMDIKWERIITIMLWISNDLYIEMVMRLHGANDENIANVYIETVEKTLYYILKDMYYSNSDVVTLVFDSASDIRDIADIIISSIDLDNGPDYDKTWLMDVLTKQGWLV